MRQVIIVSLNHKAYHMDEDAYAAVRRYLDSARNGLRDNPDTDEILGDVERAISEKCEAVLGPGKDVVSFEEMTAILQEVGPVEGDSTGASSPSGEPERAGPKRLYRQPNGAIVEGVCTGLAEYFNVDVVIFRLLFVVLALASGGIGGGLYLLMVMIVPSREPARPRVKTPWTRSQRAILISGAGLVIVSVIAMVPWLTRDIAGGRSFRGLINGMMPLPWLVLVGLVAVIFVVVAKALGGRTRSKG
jgi:phage shock protein PspC (stress-responsive transcriptional regulator)